MNSRLSSGVIMAYVYVRVVFHVGASDVEKPGYLVERGDYERAVAWVKRLQPCDFRRCCLAGILLFVDERFCARHRRTVCPRFAYYVALAVYGIIPERRFQTVHHACGKQLRWNRYSLTFRHVGTNPFVKCRRRVDSQLHQFYA